MNSGVEVICSLPVVKEVTVFTLHIDATNLKYFAPLLWLFGALVPMLLRFMELPLQCLLTHSH